MADEDAKRKEELNNSLKEYISEWRKTRKRKEIRLEQEKKLNQQKREEEEKLKAEEAERKAKEAEEKKKKLEEAEAKRQEMLEAQKAQKADAADKKKTIKCEKEDKKHVQLYRWIVVVGDTFVKTDHFRCHYTNGAKVYPSCPYGFCGNDNPLCEQEKCLP